MPDLTWHRDPNAPLAPPDLAVKKIEDGYNGASLESAMSSLNIGGHYPARPGFGTLGRQIVVYANYLKLLPTVKTLSIVRYSVAIVPEAKGRKLKRVFQLLLEDPVLAGVATDFSSMIISPGALNIPATYEKEVIYIAEGQTEPKDPPVKYTVRIITPTTLPVSQLLSYLTNTSTPLFNERDPILQGLNVVLGFIPQSNGNVISIGQNRHYPLGRAPGQYRQLGGGLEAFRGYFQSVRPATGGLLLNINVTHGVFLEPIGLHLLYPKLG